MAVNEAAVRRCSVPPSQLAIRAPGVTMTKTIYRHGQSLLIKWDISDVKGRIGRVYREGPTVELVVALDPERSGYIVFEPTTVAVPADEVWIVEPASWRRITHDQEPAQV